MSVWLHTTKGRIVGERLGGDDTWTHIKLTEDAWADVRHRHRDPAGATTTYRTSRLVEMVEVTAEEATIVMPTRAEAAEADPEPEGSST